MLEQQLTACSDHVHCIAASVVPTNHGSPELQLPTQTHLPFRRDDRWDSWPGCAFHAAEPIALMLLLIPPTIFLLSASLRLLPGKTIDT